MGVRTTKRVNYDREQQLKCKSLVESRSDTDLQMVRYTVLRLIEPSSTSLLPKIPSTSLSGEMIDLLKPERWCA